MCCDTAGIVLAALPMRAFPNIKFMQKNLFFKEDDTGFQKVAY
jgi:hypothetical protein